MKSHLQLAATVGLPALLLACVGEVGDGGNNNDPSASEEVDSEVPGTGGDADLSTGGTAGGDPVLGAGGDLSTGGTGAESSGTGGDGAGGTGTGGEGTGGDGTGGAAAALANPSPGCGKSGRPDGGRVYKAGTSWLVFPEKYDGNTPLPVLFGFHGCGSYNFGDSSRTTFWDLTRGSGFETDYVVAIPLASSGSCFDYNTDIGKAKALYDDLVNNHCVDMDRVFGSGHSSGAGFLTGMLTSDHSADFQHFGFRGIAPVSAWQMNNQTTAVPTMYIQGITDQERGGGNGKDVVDKFVSANQCSQDTTPYAVDSCNSSHDNDAVNAGCVSYGSCGAETIWCSHNDSAYSGTFHGVPCFYKQAVFDFFESL